MKLFSVYACIYLIFMSQTLLAGALFSKYYEAHLDPFQNYYLPEVPDESSVQTRTLNYQVAGSLVPIEIQYHETIPTQFGEKVTLTDQQLLAIRTTIRKQRNYPNFTDEEVLKPNSIINISELENNFNKTQFRYSELQKFNSKFKFFEYASAITQLDSSGYSYLFLIKFWDSDSNFQMIPAPLGICIFANGTPLKMIRVDYTSPAQTTRKGPTVNLNEELRKLPILCYYLDRIYLMPENYDESD